jgi:anthranilate synthase/aminodeoxychorismate synthase-like glutamine amidotransferase
VCLGHQGIIAHFGGKIIRNTKPMHGKTSQVEHSGKELFKDVTNPLSVMRYHSLIGDQNAFPECLEITARSLDDNVIMAVQHKELPIFGVQFHPESIMTEEGSKILKNFLEVQRLEVKKC